MQFDAIGGTDPLSTLATGAARLVGSAEQVLGLRPMPPTPAPPAAGDTLSLEEGLAAAGRVPGGPDAFLADGEGVDDASFGAMFNQALNDAPGLEVYHPGQGGPGVVECSAGTHGVQGNAGARGGRAPSAGLTHTPEPQVIL